MKINNKFFGFTGAMDRKHFIIYNIGASFVALFLGIIGVGIATKVYGTSFENIINILISKRSHPVQDEILGIIGLTMIPITIPLIGMDVRRMNDMFGKKSLWYFAPAIILPMIHMSLVNIMFLILAFSEGKITSKQEYVVNMNQTADESVPPPPETMADIGNKFKQKAKKAVAEKINDFTNHDERPNQNNGILPLENKLEQAKSLHEKGVISEDEYKQMRSEILQKAS